MSLERVGVEERQTEQVCVLGLGSECKARTRREMARSLKALTSPEAAAKAISKKKGRPCCLTLDRLRNDEWGGCAVVVVSCVRENRGG